LADAKKRVKTPMSLAAAQRPSDADDGLLIADLDVAPNEE